MQRRLSPFVRLRSALLTGAFFATLLVPISVAAAPIGPEAIANISTAAQARDFFLGDPQASGKLAAWFCERSDTASQNCPAADGYAKPYLRVSIVRGGQTKAADPFPLVAVGTSSGSLDQKSYQLWVFQSRENPRLVIGFHNSGPSADYTQMVILPARKATLDKETLDHINVPDPSAKVGDVAVSGGMGDLLKGPNEDSHQDEKTTQWGVTKIDVGTAGGALGSPFNRAFVAVGELINSSLSYLITQYKDLIDSLLTNNYLRFLPSVPVGTAQASSGAGVSDTAPVTSVWQFTRDIANIFFVLILLAIAFGNVLRLEYYAVRSLLPRFIAAVVLVNLSLFVSQIILDAMGVITTAFMGDVHFGDIISNGLESAVALGGAATGALFFGPFLLLTLTLAVLTVVALLVARIVMLWFLVATAPLAFTLAVLPATRELYTSWWSNFWRFALIAPAMALVLRLAAAFTTSPAPNSAGGALLRTTLIIALLFLAGTLPVMLGGKLMSNLQKFLQKRGEGLRKNAYERSLGAQTMAGVSQVMENRAEVRGARVSDALGELTAGHFGTQGRTGSVIDAQAGKLEGAADAISLTDRRRIRTRRGLSDSMRYALYLKDAKADLLGWDGWLEAGQFFGGPQLAKLASETATNNLSDIDRGDVQTSLLTVRDYLQPKFISDFHDPRYVGDPAARETARSKFARRMNAESIAKLSAGQLRDFTTQEKHAIHFYERDLKQIDDRRYHENFINLEASQAAARIMVDYDYAPAETRGRIITEAVETARRIDPTRFGQWSEIQQREIVKAARSPGVRLLRPEPTPADAHRPEMEFDEGEEEAA